MSNPNPSPATRWKKGDPRINRNGRPKSFDAAQELARAIAHEPAQKGSGDQRQPVIIDGHKATNVEVILRLWASSGDFRKQQAFMEYAFGKIPTRNEVSGPGGEPIILALVEQIIDANHAEG